MRRSERRQTVDDRVRVQHMLDAARRVSNFVHGRTRADLDSDAMLTHALMAAVAIIGEAAANVSDAGRARVPQLPWGQIVAMRHILVHVYWGVDHDRLWETATKDIPVLITALDAVLPNWPPAARPPGGTPSGAV